MVGIIIPIFSDEESETPQEIDNLSNTTYLIEKPEIQPRSVRLLRPVLL